MGIQKTAQPRLLENVLENVRDKLVENLPEESFENLLEGIVENLLWDYLSDPGYKYACLRIRRKWVACLPPISRGDWPEESNQSPWTSASESSCTR